jgi:hypothetical protein
MFTYTSPYEGNSGKITEKAERKLENYFQKLYTLPRLSEEEKDEKNDENILTLYVFIRREINFRVYEQ